MDHNPSISQQVLAAARQNEQCIKQKEWGEGLTAAKRASTTLLRVAQAGCVPPYLLSQIAALHRAIHDKVPLGLRLVAKGEKT